MTPEEIIGTYQRQQRSRIRWFIIAAIIACVTAAVAKYALGSAYPWWRLAVLVWGLLYVPWFVAQAYRKDNISIRAAMNARRELTQIRATSENMMIVHLTERCRWQEIQDGGRLLPMSQQPGRMGRSRTGYEPNYLYAVRIAESPPREVWEQLRHACAGWRDPIAGTILAGVMNDNERPPGFHAVHAEDIVVLEIDDDAAVAWQVVDGEEELKGAGVDQEWIRKIKYVATDSSISTDHVSVLYPEVDSSTNVPRK
jgi:hypothetical protein